MGRLRCYFLKMAFDIECSGKGNGLFIRLITLLLYADGVLTLGQVKIKTGGAFVVTIDIDLSISGA